METAYVRQGLKVINCDFRYCQLLMCSFLVLVSYKYDVSSISLCSPIDVFLEFLRSGDCWDAMNPYLGCEVLVVL